MVMVTAVKVRAAGRRDRIRCVDLEIRRRPARGYVDDRSQDSRQQTDSGLSNTARPQHLVVKHQHARIVEIELALIVEQNNQAPVCDGLEPIVSLDT